MKKLKILLDKQISIVYRILLGCCICLIPLTATAQVDGEAWKAKIYMKNGQKFKGLLYEVGTGTPINLHIGASSVAEIDTADVAKVKMAHLNNRRNRSVMYSYAGNDGFQQHRGYYHHVFAGLSAGQEHGNISVGFINGMWLSDRFALGLGFNYDNYPNIAALPVYIQPRYYLKNDKISLFGFTDVGYAWAWQERSSNDFSETHSVSGGLMGQIGVGYQINFLKSALTFSVGYKLQQSQIEYEYYGWPSWSSFWPGQRWSTQAIQVEEKRLIRRAVFTIGFAL